MLGDEEALATDINIGESTLPINEMYAQDGDGEEEEDTKALFRVWLNERMAPTLLPFAERTMSNIMELISNQTALMEEQAETEQTSQTAYLSCLFQMEIERLKYVLSSYLRCRLRKLEHFWLHWMTHPEELNGIASEHEIEFLSAFCKAKREALYASVLQHLPPAMVNLPGEDVEERRDAMEGSGGKGRRPRTDSFVICRVLNDLGPVQVDPSGMVADLVKDDIYIIQYEMAEPLLAQNHILLI